MDFDLGSLLKSRFDVSVVIPVESHRGQTVACVRGWAQEQDYPAEQYQIILCAPDSLDSETELEIRAMLRPWDHLEKRPYHHDMPLITEGAYLAESEVLFFTESHCLPEKSALRQLLDVRKSHPEWCGFSCQTIPITHNLLSKIEAEIYVAHIKSELESSRGLKVIDQCFLVDRTAYFKAGGFRAQFGHFAEWLLATEMQKLGFVIGFSPIQVIKHYYIGDVIDLEAFTLDFARGHIKYLAEFDHESTSTYFPTIPELSEYVTRSMVDYRMMANWKTITLPVMIFNFIKKLKNREVAVPITLIVWDWFESVCKALIPRSIVAFAWWSAYCTKRRVLQAIKSQQHEQVRAEFVVWFARLVHLARVQYLHESSSIRHQYIRSQNYPISDVINFTVEPQLKSTVELLGFYDQEEVSYNQHVRWSKSHACVWLPMHEGSYQVIIKWDSVRPINAYDLLKINFNGRLISTKDMTLSPNQLVVNVAVRKKSWCCLGWSVVPFPAVNDKRLLGLPISSIRWYSKSHELNSQDDGIVAKLSTQPVYFLHVSKCAGTSLRSILDNAYHSSSIMSPYFGRYYPDDLQGIESERVFDYYRGHFRWLLPSALPDQNWRVVTVLRHPVDRMLSRFYYLKQYGVIHEAKSFTEWFEHDLAASDTLTSYFLSDKLNSNELGANFVKKITSESLGEAQANLEKCLAVGVVESMEDSVNIFAWHLGFLPPKILSKCNPTLVRDSVSAISDDLRLRVEQTLSADMVLYSRAQQIFSASKLAMFTSIGLDVSGKSETVAVRNYLRQKYVNQLCQSAQHANGSTHLKWMPDDIFHGENLHVRELCDGKCLRWTGPEPTTNFYFHLGKPCNRLITISLHPATPRKHAESVQLNMNGFDVPLKISYMASGEIKLLGNLTEEMCMQSANNVAEFLMTTATVQGEGEFRMLGVALMGMSIIAV